MGHLYQNWLFIYWTKAIAVAALGAAASTSSINLGWHCKEWTSETVCRSTKRIAFMNGFERRSVALTCDKDARLLKWLDPSRTPFSNEFKSDLHKLWVCFKTGYTIVYFQKSRIFEYPIQNDARTEATNSKSLLWFGVWEAFFVESAVFNGLCWAGWLEQTRVICTFNAYVFLLFELMLPKMMAFQGHWNHQCILYINVTKTRPWCRPLLITPEKETTTCMQSSRSSATTMRILTDCL